MSLDAGGSRRPDPDPTLLTTEALLREIRHVRELYDLRLDQLDLRLQQRFEAQSKALDAAKADADAKTGALSAKIDELRNLASSAAGRSTGVGQSWGVLVGAIGVISVVVALILKVRGQ